MNYLTDTNGYGIKTPYDDKIAEAVRILKGEEKPSYVPQLYKMEDEDHIEPVFLPVQWAKENPHLKPAVKISVDFAALNKGLAAVVAAFDNLVENIKKYSWYAARIAANIKDYPNKRVIYLATHGKRRVRKKNINRIKKYFEREGNKRAEFGP